MTEDNDPYQPPSSEKDKLDAIAEAIGSIFWVVIIYGLFGLAALWRILFELQRGG